MPVITDPEEREIAALFDFAGDLSGRRLLEIGCGDGRLTWRYAGQAESVVAIEPDAEQIAKARASTPASLSAKVAFHAASLEEFAAQPELGARLGSFDLVLLSWAL